MSSYVIAAPEALAAASEDLTGIQEAIREATAAAAPSTTGIVAAAGDEVSAAIANIFGGYAKEFQTLTAQAALFHSEFVQALSSAAATYAAAEAANVSPLQALEQKVESLLVAPIEALITPPLFVGPRIATLGAVLNWATNAVGLGGLVNFPSTVALTGPGIDGVTGVRVGFSIVGIPLGEASFLGIPLGFDISYPAPALWYFPTQATGAVQANGTIYFQHGFGAIGWLYQPLAIQLAESTDSVVLTPSVPFIPLPFGAWLGGTQMQQGVAALFLGSQSGLNFSANNAGLHGTLPQDFILSGHSAGGGLATIAAGDYLADLGTSPNHLQGVITFDGVASSSTAYAAAIANLQAAHTPVYVVSAPPQAWNAYGATTNELVSLNPNNFNGVELAGGSHVDSMLGDKPVIDLVLQLVTQFSPPGNTQAAYTLSSGWINDIYTGHGPTDPLYGIYGPGPGYEYVSPGGQTIPLGQATGIVLP